MACRCKVLTNIRVVDSIPKALLETDIQRQIYYSIMIYRQGGTCIYGHGVFQHPKMKNMYVHLHFKKENQHSLYRLIYCLFANFFFTVLVRTSFICCLCVGLSPAMSKES